MRDEAPTVTKNGIPHYRMFIDGGWVDTADRYEIVNPATEDITATAASRGSRSRRSAPVRPGCRSARHSRSPWDSRRCTCSTTPS